MLTTTVSLLRQHQACTRGMDKLLPTVTDLNRIELGHILRTNGFDDAIWALRATTDPGAAHRVVRSLALAAGARAADVWEAAHLAHPVRHLLEIGDPDQAAGAWEHVNWLQFELCPLEAMAPISVAASAVARTVFTLHTDPRAFGPAITHCLHLAQYAATDPAAEQQTQIAQFKKLLSQDS